MPETTATHFDVSVIVCSYNAAEYLPRAIDSILNQTVAANEIIIVDDGSTDDTKSVIASYGDAVRYIYQDNAGPGAARNAGIKAACSEWVAFLDADDEWDNHKLEWQIGVLRQCPNLAWVSGNYKRCFCQQGYELIKDKPQRIQTLLAGKEYFDDYIKAFVLKAHGHTSAMLVRKDVLLDVGLFRTDSSFGEDVDLWLRIAYHHPKIGYIAEPVETYHMETGESLASQLMDYSAMKQFVQRHLDFAKEAGRRDAFAPCAKTMLQAWIRSAFFDDRVYDIRKAIQDFNILLSMKYERTVYMMTILPGLTKRILQGLSWLSRTFKLRRQAWHSKVRYKRN